MASISAPCPKCPKAGALAGAGPPSVGSGRLTFPREADQRRFPILKAQAREISTADSSGSKDSTKLEVLSKNGSLTDLSHQPVAQDEVSDSAISAFVAEASRLVMLIDSKDVSELQLKHNDFGIIIKKKEALQSVPPVGPPVTTVYSHPLPPQQLPMAQPVSSHPIASPEPAAPTSTPALAPAKSGSKSSLPALKSPMAGTFYRSPAPGEPAFVKVGDKVKKGQVVCIIEAMKLMNEIEADQAGTIVDISAEDGKPVSVDEPLLIIQP